MANIPIDVAPGSYPTASTITVCTQTAGSSGGDAFDCTGRELLIVENQGEAAQDITINGVPDATGRDVTIMQELAIDGFFVIGPFTRPAGWVTPSGQIEVLAETPADVRWTVIRLPQE